MICQSCALQSQFSEALSETSYDYIFTSSMYLLKVEEKVSKSNANSKIVLLADNADIKNSYDYTTILLPANSISIANVVNGKSANGTIANARETTHFTAPECNVLIVDDNMVNIKVAQGLMKPYNFNIDTAENGAVAVEKIKNTHFDLVFMDHMMPIMDGIDATIAIREMDEEYYQKLPIIALTANAIIGTREMFINEGMNDFLAKPIKVNTLHETLMKWLPADKLIFIDKDEISSQDEAVEVIEDEVNSENATLQIHCIDTARGLKSIGGNFDAYIEILKMYYADALKRIPNIREAFEKEVLLEYKIDVHALKSASLSIGAVAISENARLLEHAATKKDITYIKQHTSEFLDDLTILLDNINKALENFTEDYSGSDKENGDMAFFTESLKKLQEALDGMNIERCEVVLTEIMEFKWDAKEVETIKKIKEFLISYDYDSASEFIAEVI